MTEDALEREFESIRKVSKGFKDGEKPLRIEWGPKKAFERQEQYMLKEDLRHRIRTYLKRFRQPNRQPNEPPSISEIQEGILLLLEGLKEDLISLSFSVGVQA